MKKYGLVYALAVLFLLFVYYLFIAFKEDSAVQKPEKLYREKGLILFVILVAVILGILTVVDLPGLSLFQEPFLIQLSRAASSGCAAAVS